MRAYSATFQAAVQDGTESKTKLLKFQLHGEGTLPSVTVEKPTKVDEDGNIIEEGSMRNLIIIRTNIVFIVVFTV